MATFKRKCTNQYKMQLRKEFFDFFNQNDCSNDNNQNYEYESIENLMPHQKQGVRWMINRENCGHPNGGILADEMGLGKTLCMLKLISKDIKASEKKTIIICPLSLINHWINEIKKHNLELKVFKYYKCGFENDLQSFNVVITTYDTLVAQFKLSIKNNEKSGLFTKNWYRIVLDEAHIIKNHKTQVHRASCMLKGMYRWCITGTPIHNKHWDMYSIIKFLKCNPFDNFLIWSKMNSKKNTSLSGDRIKTIVNKIVLKRNRLEVLSDALCNNNVKHVFVEGNEIEKLIYKKLKQESEQAYMKIMECDAENNVKDKLKQIRRVLWLVLKLRQICCHPYLTIANNKDDIFNDFIIDYPETFSPNYISSKCEQVLKLVETLLCTTDDKIVIMSQWVQYLKLFENFFNQRNIKTLMYTGQLKVAERFAVETSFNSKDHCQIRVLLVSIKCGGMGLNLIGGNHVILLEPHWNPQIELQAQDRINRLGQTKTTYVYKILFDVDIETESIERYIKKRQEDKVKFVNTVFEKTTPKFEDIKNFFLKM